MITKGVCSVYAAVVLAGGYGRRMGGQDKVLREVAGRRLLDRVLDACRGATEVVVVGPRVPVDRLVRWVIEEPAGGGPVPALRAGLAEVRAQQVAVLAADLPFLLPSDLDLLATLAAAPAAGAVLVDGSGRAQWLAGVWRTEPLRAALDGYTGDSLRGLLGPLRPRPLGVRADVRPPPWLDCDSAADLAAASRYAAGEP